LTIYLFGARKKLGGEDACKMLVKLAIGKLNFEDDEEIKSFSQ
jgi:hypothetical protein